MDIGWSLYYSIENLGEIKDQLLFFAPLLEQWIGKDYEKYYRANLDYYSFRPDEDFLLTIGHNTSYNKSDYDNDRFLYEIGCVDSKGLLTEDEHASRITAALALLWASNIPTCLPNWYREKMGYEDDYNGPVLWTEVK